MGSSLNRDWVYIGNQFRAATGFDHVIRFDDVGGFKNFAPTNNGAADASRDLIEKLDSRPGPLVDQSQSDSFRAQTDLCQNQSLEVDWSARVDQVLDRLSDLLQEDELEWGIGPERPHANNAM